MSTAPYIVKVYYQIDTIDIITGKIRMNEQLTVLLNCERPETHSAWKEPEISMREYMFKKFRPTNFIDENNYFKIDNVEKKIKMNLEIQTIRYSVLNHLFNGCEDSLHDLKKFCKKKNVQIIEGIPDVNRALIRVYQNIYE